MNKKIAETLSKGGVGILPTDTIYGIVGSALSKKSVQRIYKLRKRSPIKPMIILIGSLKDLRLFGIRPSNETMKQLKKFWPGKVSIIFPCRGKKFSYLHRGTKTLAFRMPKKAGLIRLLKKTGPLVAPSANPEGLPPAKTIKEAKKYFGKGADFYVDGGKMYLSPSTLITIESGKAIIKRQGAVKIQSI